MGVTHSMDEKQVARISNALKGSADAIQGINKKFEVAEAHYKRLHSFQGKMNGQVEGSLDACARLDYTVRSRVDTAHIHFEDAMMGFTQILESMIDLLEGLDIHREVSQLPAAMVPLMVPLVILLIELAVANAYMGILIASMPEVRERYSWCSPFLLANASCVLFGLTLSLVWLVGYRIWLSCGNSRKVMRDAFEEENALQLEERAVTPAEDADDGKLKDIWRRIDVDCSDSMSKLEFISAINQDPEVAALVLPGVDTGSLLSDEEIFDVADAAFGAISGGKTRVCYAEFVDYFRRASPSKAPVDDFLEEEALCNDEPRAPPRKDRGGSDLPCAFESPKRKLSRSASLPSLEEQLPGGPRRPPQSHSRSLEAPAEPRLRRSVEVTEEKRCSLQVPEDPHLEARSSAGSRASRASGSGRALSASGSWQLGSGELLRGDSLAGLRPLSRTTSDRVRGSGTPVLERRGTDGSSGVGRRPTDFGERRSLARRRITDRTDPIARRELQRRRHEMRE